MFSVKAIHIIGKKTLPLSVALSIALFHPTVLHAGDEHSYAQEIERDVAEDKVYLLENIRQKVTIPSEKTVLEALLCEDGPQAIILFQKQLREYPDPAIDKLSTSRIAAYNVALDNSASLPKQSIRRSSAKQQLSVVKADTTKHLSKTSSNTERFSVVKEDTTKHSAKQSTNIALPSDVQNDEKIVAGPTTSTLQFGCFESRKNAETLAKEIAQHAPVEIVQKGQMYKVQLKTHYPSNEEATTAAKKLPVKSIVVPSI